jgi:dihydroorotate dehydrogenase
MSLGYSAVRRLLFRLDPERAHHLTLGLLRLAGWFPPSRAWLQSAFGKNGPGLAMQAMGLPFPNPLGLAAGYDKDGLALAGLACLGFGHIELGAVTLQPQRGQRRPRIFRLEADQALINQMGFPNRGVEALVGRLRRAAPSVVRLGINLGKGAETPLERADEDYARLLAAVYDVVDYVTLNLSSPNTPGLRQLQSGVYLERLLDKVTRARHRLTVERGRRVPLAVKLSPDLDPADLETAVDAAVAFGLDGILAVNTTRARAGLASPKAAEAGGLSGRPLWPGSLHIVERIRSKAGGAISVIGIGGIDSPERARQMLDSGADLVQLYTGLVYNGPSLPGSILRSLAESRTKADDRSSRAA